MQIFSQILLILGAGVILWLSYTTIKKHPGLFSAANLNKSIFTLGILALFLIGIIFMLVMLLKH